MRRSAEADVPRVVVVGGGIAGLATAYRIGRSDPDAGSVDVTLLEASERLGGALGALGLDGLTVEAGADSFVVRKPWAADLCRELGLGGTGGLIHPALRGAFA